MTSKCEIILDNYTGHYNPGDTVSGKVDCYFHKSTKMREIRLKYKGKAKTAWTASKTHHKGKEIYFENTITLFKGGEDFMMPQGSYSYPFQFVLPSELPSTFHDKYNAASIRYTIKAVVDIPWEIDYQSKVAFCVFSLVDLNDYQVFPNREPVRNLTEGTACCFCCKSGPIIFDVTLPTTGFVPGQTVDIAAKIENMSNVNVQSVAFKLVLKLIVNSSHSSATKEEFTDLHSVREGGVRANGEKSWITKFTLPATTEVPNFRTCGIIHAYYALKAKAVLPCPYPNVRMEFKITLGTVPLRANSNIESALPPSYPSVASAPYAPQDESNNHYPEKTALLNQPPPNSSSFWTDFSADRSQPTNYGQYPFPKSSE